MLGLYIPIKLLNQTNLLPKSTGFTPTLSSHCKNFSLRHHVHRKLSLSTNHYPVMSPTTATRANMPKLNLLLARARPLPVLSLINAVLFPCTSSPLCLSVLACLLLQFWAAFVPCEAQHKDAVQITLEQIDVIKRLTERYSPHLTACTSVHGKYIPRPVCALL